MVGDLSDSNNPSSKVESEAQEPAAAEQLEEEEGEDEEGEEEEEGEDEHFGVAESLLQVSTAESRPDAAQQQQQVQPHEQADAGKPEVRLAHFGA